jgi:AcrR family transcriptional regulator
VSKNATNTGRRAGLDRNDMVAAALALVEADGVGALTMRRLAAELDVTTNTIYWHVGSRDELILEIIRSHSRQIAELPIEGTTAQERVFSAARHIWESSMASRSVTSLAHQTGTAAEHLHPLEVVLAQELEAAGLRGEELARAQRSIQVTVGGFLLNALRSDASREGDARGAAWTDEDNGLTPETVDALAQSPDYDALLADTLRAIIATHVG